MYVIYEGYFKGPSESEKHYPLARARTTKWLGRREFMDALTKVQNSKKVEIEAFRGHSKCRICGAKNGHEEFVLKIGKIEWRWPSGFLHYVEEHNVRPGLAFQMLINQLADNLG